MNNLIYLTNHINSTYSILTNPSNLTNPTWGNGEMGTVWGNPMYIVHASFFSFVNKMT